MFTEPQASPSHHTSHNPDLAAPQHLCPQQSPKPFCGTKTTQQCHKTPPILPKPLWNIISEDLGQSSSEGRLGMSLRKANPWPGPRPNFIHVPPVLPPAFGALNTKQEQLQAG